MSMLMLASIVRPDFRDNSRDAATAWQMNRRSEERQVKSCYAGSEAKDSTRVRRSPLNISEPITH